MAGILFQPEAQKPLKEGSFWTLMRLMQNWESRWNKMEVYQSILEALEGADAIIASPLIFTPAYCVAEKIGAAFIPMLLGPTVMTSEFPIWPLKNMIPFSCLYKWSYSLVFSSLWGQEKKFINEWRGKLGLSPLDKGLVYVIDEKRIPTIIAASPLLCPNRRKPLDYPEHVHFHGFVFVPSMSETELNADPTVAALKEFIAHPDPRPIVYLGFGSMPAPDVDELIRLALDVCSKCQCRGVLVSGWNDFLSEQSKVKDLWQAAVESHTIINVKAVAHEWLFPQTRCIVHHGGVSTLSSSSQLTKAHENCSCI
jgi:sterol 3beta-glucosyltransferase